MGWIPAAIEGVMSVVGAFTSAAQQKHDQEAQQQLQQQQEGVYSTQQGLAQQLANGPALQPLINAEGSGAKTLMSNMGGYANPGAVIEDVLGNNITQALDASIANQRANLEGAAGILNPVAAGYGNLGSQAGNAAAAIGNPWQNALGGIGGAIGKITNPAGGTTASGGGALGGWTPGQPLPSTVNPQTGSGIGAWSPGDPLPPTFDATASSNAQTGTATGYGGGSGAK